jgi:hypothetical protein
MTPEDLTDWIQTARDQEAARVHVKRGTKPGQKNATLLFLDLDLTGLDVGKLLTRMRDDIRSRRLVSAWFQLDAVSEDGKSLLSERISLGRDEAIPGSADSAVEEPGVAIARLTLDGAKDAYAQMRQMAEGQATFLTAVSSVVKGMGEAQVAGNARTEQMMKDFFEMFVLKNERDAELKASEDRRAIAKDAFATLAPIAAMGISAMAKHAGASWGELFKSLLSDPERFQAFMGMLKPQEIAALEQAMNMQFPKPETKSATNGAA